MESIFLILINSEKYSNDVVSICSNRETAEDLMEMYYRNWEDNGYSREDVEYSIQEVSLDSEKNVLWDCINTIEDE